tara:strand:- start:711 stop:872 length:162 start_codon:yes stop_codon:yes gene_type:complete
MSLEEEVKFIKDKTQIETSVFRDMLGRSDKKQIDDEIENGRVADRETIMKLYT